MTALEILAPARTADIGIAAIRCGADAVYIGGPSFGARAAAGNSIADIERLCREAALYGVRIYVTVNTLAKNSEERRALVDMILSMKDKGISAFIMQDETLPSTLAPYGPWKEEFHASTQCTITSVERAQELVRAGFSRLILERQLSLEQIRAIRSAIPSNVELECFVHGALCVCYSGACYLSEYLTGRSANRGECSQPCRSRYDLVREDGEVLVSDSPLLSLKDLNLSSRLADLADAGVVSFKIEGRLKDESYVKNVVRYYSETLNGLVANSKGRYIRNSFGSCRGGFVPDPDKTFNRGYTELYIDGVRGKWNSGSATKGVGEYLGVVEKVEKNLRAPSFCLASGVRLNNGDGLCFEGRDGTITGFRADRIDKLGPDCQRVICKSTELISKGCRVWRNSDIRFEKELETFLPSRLVSAEVQAEFIWNGTGATVHIDVLREDGIKLTKEVCYGDAVTADKQERMQALFKSQVEKNSGRSIFLVTGIKGHMPIMSASSINQIRRELAQQLEEIPIVPRERYEPLPPTAQYTESQSFDNLQIEDMPLMTTRYCILSELGWCLKTEAGRKAVGGQKLALVNNGKRFALAFDCKNCSMSVCYMQKK